MNNPDKIIFVGEALVGNEAVDQLTKFDRALRDFSTASGAGQGRGIDGMLVTKWDTVDDKVRCRSDGAAVSQKVNVKAFAFAFFFFSGWGCVVDDVCDGTTYHIRRMRAGEY